MASLKRRSALKLGLGVGVGTVASVGVGTGTASAKGEPVITGVEDAAAAIAAVYEHETTAAGGLWHSYITVAGTDGTLVEAVDENSGTVVEAMSTNKLPVAVNVLDKVDNGLVTLENKVQVADPYIVWNGDGIIPFDGSHPSEMILGHAISLLLSISEDTSSRLCAQVTTAAEINDYLTGLGFGDIWVEPVPGTPRWYLGTTTPKAMHDFWRALVTGGLLSASSTEYLLKIMRCADAHNEGIRHRLTTPERLRVATKGGWNDSWRNEAGVIYNEAGAPLVTYALYSSYEENQDDYSSNHPMIKARARMGRKFFDIAQQLAGASGLSTMDAEDVRDEYEPGIG